MHARLHRCRLMAMRSSTMRCLYDANQTRSVQVDMRQGLLCYEPGVH